MGQNPLEFLGVEQTEDAVVTQTTARSGERPVAKALGFGVSAMPTRGLGMSAKAHSRSIMP